MKIVLPHTISPSTLLTYHLLQRRLRVLIPEGEAVLHKRLVLITHVLSEALLSNGNDVWSADALVVREEEDAFASIVDELSEEKVADIVEGLENFLARLNTLEDIEALQMSLHGQDATCVAGDLALLRLILSLLLGLTLNIGLALIG